MSFSYVFAAWWLLLLHALVMAQRFGAMNAVAAPTLSPRYYQVAHPLRPLQVGKRQELAPCPGGQHACSDIGPLGVGSCCPDDTYCIVDPSDASKASCCAIGSVCNSPCAASEYQCIITVTITSTTPSTTTTTTSTSPACCPRQCTLTSMFGCASSMGGGCCSYGQTCASSGQCLWTGRTSASSIVSQIPPGCTTSQIACPSSLGGGCCAASQSCTLAGTGPACAGITVAPPTASGVAAVPQHNSTRLGTGAKAGIAVGVVVLAGLAVGLATLCILRRRRRGSSQGTTRGPGSTTLTAGSASSPRPPPPPPPQPTPRRTGLGILDRARSNEMSESHSPPTVSRTTGRLRGLAADYFGPAAVAGPFTEGNTEAGSPTSVATTPQPGGNNRDRAVPREPHSPDDITAPVEIDSQAKQRDVSETIAGRFELCGTTEQQQLASPNSEATSPYEELVSPYTPSPGMGTERHTLPSPTLGHQSKRW